MDSFYKGYIKTNGKKAIEPFKDRDNFSDLKTIKNYNSYAGVLAEDSMIIDIDDGAQANLMLRMVNALNIRTKVIKTSRGLHFLFKNTVIEQCYTHTPLAVGVTADIKVGKKNSYQVLKIDGVTRPVVYDTGEPYDCLPLPFVPIKSNKYRDFNTYIEGNRNTSLFAYVAVLKANGLDNNEIINIINLINQYILPLPLSDTELKDTVLRPDAFAIEPHLVRNNIGGKAEKFFTRSGKFLHAEFSKYIAEKYSVKKINGHICIYKDGLYCGDKKILENIMIRELPELTDAKRSEVYKYLDVLIIDETEKSSPYLILFKNGILDIRTGKLLEFTPDYIFTNRIAYKYNPSASSDIVDKVFSKITLGDEQLEDLLYEIAGYTMFNKQELGKAFVLVGNGSNGKSTYLRMLQQMLGDNNISTVDLQKLDDRFSTVMTVDKLANISDDTSDSFISDTSTFKKMVTGEMVQAEQKGQPVFMFRPTAKIIVSTNSMPRFGKGKDTEAIKRRLVFVPFNAKFSKDDADFDPYIIDKLLTDEAIEYLIANAVLALSNVLKNKQFTETTAMKKRLDEFELDNNPLLRFFEYVDENMINKQQISPFGSVSVDKLDGMETQMLYNHYVEWCKDEGVQTNSKNSFMKIFSNNYSDRYRIEVVRSKISTTRVLKKIE